MLSYQIKYHMLKFTEIICELSRNKVRARAKRPPEKPTEEVKLESSFLTGAIQLLLITIHITTDVLRLHSTFNAFLTSPETFLTPHKDTAVFSLV